VSRTTPTTPRRPTRGGAGEGESLRGAAIEQPPEDSELPEPTLAAGKQKSPLAGPLHTN
jgi:hypothetical protein